MNIRLIPSILIACMAALSAGAAQPVVFIGADGMSTRVVKDNPGAFPNIELLIKNGSSTNESRTVLPSSSAANWCSILTGSSPELHGFTQATSKEPEVVPRVIGNYGSYPGIYGLVRDQQPRAVTGYFYEWGGMKFVCEEKAATKALQGNGDIIEKEAIKFIGKQKPLLTFIVFDQPDGVGHSKGWDSPEYLEKCKEIDARVGRIITAVRESPQGKETVIIFASDHGGKEKTHGGKSMEEMNHMLVYCGKGIKKGYTIKDSLMIYDIGSTIARLLDVKQPQCWIGRPVTEMFEAKR